MALLMYGPTIVDALERRETTLNELLTLQEHARAILHAQGDLQAAVQRLDAEIARRQRS